MTSPTTVADLWYGRFQTKFCWYIENRMRRCTGFMPSRTSGSARLTITLIA
jgi:hypothetical protein